MRIAVTGGTGFIGRVLVEALERRDDTIKILSRSAIPPTGTGRLAIIGDLLREDCPLEELVADSNVIFHCAGEVRDPAKMRDLHVDATSRLLQAAKNEAESRQQPIHWVQLSSVGAYGQALGGSRQPKIVTESTATNPVAEYEISKTIADELVLESCRHHLLSCSIVRPSNVYGKNMPNSSLRALAGAIRNGWFFYIGPPGAIATYIHVEDVVQALVDCAKDPRARGQIFNLSNDCSLEELINGLADSLGVPRPRRRLPESLVRLLTRVVSPFGRFPLTSQRIDALTSMTRYPSKKIEAELGFIPQRTIGETIGEALIMD